MQEGTMRPGEVISLIENLLPHTPDNRIWSCEGEILVKTEQLANAIADLFDAMYGEPTVNTGYYDPSEDERNEETDDCTGFWYIAVN